MQRFDAAFKEAAHAARGLADSLLVLHQGDADIALAVLAKGDAGETTTPDFSTIRVANCMLPRLSKALGSGAHANIEASGGGISQPARLKDSTSVSRRLR